MAKKKAKSKSRPKVKPKKKTFPPDWKNESAYPDSETTTGKQWAWEFLRRNPDFQEGCKKLKSGQHKSFVHDPPFKPNESPVEYRIRTGASPFRRIDIRSYLAKKWCVDNIYEIDEQSDFEKVRFRSTYEPVNVIDCPNEYECSGGGFPTLSKTEILLSFDLRQPVSQLIKDAEYYLRDERKALKKAGKLKDLKKRNKFYPKYLRFLDAKAARVSHSQIAEVFFPDTSDCYPAHKARHQVKEVLKAARLLRDHDYKKLLK